MGEEGPEGWTDREETRYWERALESAVSAYERESAEVRAEREALTGYARQHFLFAGFVVGVHLLSPVGTPAAGRHVLLAAVPSVVGVLYMAHGRRSLTSRTLDFEDRILERVHDTADNYDDAVRTLAHRYHDLSDIERRRCENHSQYARHHVLLLAVGFGTLVGTLVVE